MLYLFNVTIERIDNLIFAFKLSFYQFKVFNFIILSFQVIFEVFNFFLKLSNIFILLCGNRFNDFIFVLLKDLIYLREVRLDDVSHTSKDFQKLRDLIFIFKLNVGNFLDFRLHCINMLSNFILIGSILRDKWALDLHNCLNDKLELVDFRFLLFWSDVVIFDNLCNCLI
jgi:hypothetical protein